MLVMMDAAVCGSIFKVIDQQEPTASSQDHSKMKEAKKMIWFISNRLLKIRKHLILLIDDLDQI